MKTIRKKLSELKSPERNVRMHTDKQIAEFKRSIEMFGQIRPIVIDENNVMLAGNGLYATLKAMGKEEADCLVMSGLSENEKKKLMLADNKIFDLGVDDMSAFDTILEELAGDLDIPGYDYDMLLAITSTPDFVDDIISEYGIVPEERREEMVRNQVVNDAPTAVGAHPQQPSLQQEEESVAGQRAEPTETDRSVVCPHCGERIWL